MALTAPVEGGGPEECVLLEVNSGPRQCKTEAAMQVRGLRNHHLGMKMYGLGTFM